jgi:hypothetical protein
VQLWKPAPASASAAAISDSEFSVIRRKKKEKCFEVIIRQQAITRVISLGVLYSHCGQQGCGNRFLAYRAVPPRDIAAFHVFLADSNPLDAGSESGSKIV